MAEAAKRGIPTCMELGGKSCLIVFDDANVDDAVEWAMVSMLPHTYFPDRLPSPVPLIDSADASACSGHCPSSLTEHKTQLWAFLLLLDS